MRKQENEEEEENAIKEGDDAGTGGEKKGYITWLSHLKGPSTSTVSSVTSKQ